MSASNDRANASPSEVKFLRHFPVLGEFISRAEPPEYTWRLLTYFGVARIVIALAILFYFGQKGSSSITTTQVTANIFGAGFAYLIVATISLAWVFLSRRYFYLQLTISLVFDVLGLSACYLILESFRADLAILFLLPVLGTAVLGTVTTALFAAAVCSLVILYIPFRAVLFQDSSELGLLQGGLYGLALMAIAFLMRVLARRQIAQEVLAAEREYTLQLQQIIHRLMVHDMQDGVLLARSDGSVMAINPAANQLIGLTLRNSGIFQVNHHQTTEGLPMRQIPHLFPLYDALRYWVRTHDDAPVMLEINRPEMLTSDSSGIETKVPPSKMRLRVRFVSPTLDAQQDAGSLLTTRSPHWQWSEHLFHDDKNQKRFAKLPDSMRDSLNNTVLIYVESWEKVTEQAQQEKLAAMGRLVASIAHEIRNPLAAISHANELLVDELRQETTSLALPGIVDSPSPTALMPERMLKIIGDNVKRLDRIVSDVLLLSRRSRTEAEPIMLQKEVTDIVEQWRRNAELGHSLGKVQNGVSLNKGVNANLVRVQIDSIAPVRFDRDQLQQVLYNLLDNARRYCRQFPGSILVSAYEVDTQHAELLVWNDGEEITPEVEHNLFEPFFTSEAQGTGLGLYLARELCHANQAHIRYGEAQIARLHAALSPLGMFGQASVNHRAFLITMRLDRPN